MFVAHAPERIAENHFVEEIATLPHIIGGVDDESTERGRAAVRGLRLAHRQDDARAGGAGEDLDQHLPLHELRPPEPADDELRAVRRERLRGDRPDQPRLPARRDRDARPHRRDVSAQGLRVLGGALERAGHAAGRVARERERPALPGRGDQERLGSLQGKEGRRARPHVQAQLRRPARLARRSSWCACSNASSPRSRLTTRTRPPPPTRSQDAVSGAAAVVVATNHDEFAEPETLRLIVERAGSRMPGRRSLERVRRGAACSRAPTRSLALARPVASRPPPACRSRARPPLGIARGSRHRRRRHDRQRGRAPAAPTDRWTCASPTSARPRTGCASAARSTPADLRETESAARRRSRAARTSVHLAAIVGGIANFHKLPYTLLEANNALYNALFRAAIDAGVERFVYVSSSMAFERAEEFPTTEERARPHAHAALVVRLLEARGRVLLPRGDRTSSACASRSCGRSTPTARASIPGDEPGIAHLVPDLIERACAASGRSRSSGPASRRAPSRTSTTSRTASSRR